MTAFFNMGGYGIWIWPAWGVTLAVFLINMHFAAREKKAILQRIRRFYNRSPHESITS